MTHHEVDVVLSKMIKGHPFGNDTPDHLMSYFAATLLVGTLRIAEEDTCTEFAGAPVTFNGGGISKFTASVSENHREKLLKSLSSKDCIKRVEDFCDGSGRIVVPNEGKHEFTAGEEDSRRWAETNILDAQIQQGQQHA